MSTPDRRIDLEKFISGDPDSVVVAGPPEWKKTETSSTGPQTESPTPDEALGQLERIMKSTARFNLTRATDFAKIIECRDFVEGVFCDKTLGRMFGPPGSAKTFLGLELGRCVATGSPFNGRAVEAGRVCYLALEGQAGIANRLAAMRKVGRLPSDAEFFVCPDEFSALLDLDVTDLAAAINGVGEFRLIVVDTQARAMGGGDENSSVDIGKLVKSMGELIRLTGAAVLLLHHPGKDAGRGGRGHSSALGAVDTELELTVIESGGEKVRVVSARKQKDLPEGDDFAFTLSSVHLGTDRRGKAITSCVVEWCNPPVASTTGRPRLVTPEHVLAELETGAMIQTALIDKLAKKCGCGYSTVKDAIALARLGGVVGKKEPMPNTNRTTTWLYHPKHA
jgi:hypothetical protein